MKLEVDVNEVTLSGTGSTGEFRIRNSAKAFKILSDGLYSNKIRAIIRELSCNAVDSHVAAGKEKVPFEVHLPTVLEPWFSVRDFGLGLSGDQVTNIYTTYFESTKTDSNEFIGALGLGSKSPFSYTENFTITAIKDGTKRIYSAFINEAGIPCVAEMSTELTDEGNGVEVKFSVTNRYDYDSFRNEAQEVFKWFRNIPVITGLANFEIRPVQYKEKDIVPGIHTQEIRNSYYGTPSVALMGNIAYPLNKIPDPNKHFGHLASLLECGLIIEFKIGDLDFAASREELSYIPLTFSSIKARLVELNTNLLKHLSEKADKIENEWKRAGYLSEQYQTKLYHSAVPEYIKNTNFKLFNIHNHYGRYEFEFKKDVLDEHGLEITAFRSHGRSTSKMTISHATYIKNTSNLETITTIPLSQDSIFVINDLKTGCQARAKYHYSNTNISSTIYCVTSTKPVDERQADYDWLMAELCNPPTVVKASSLTKPEKKKPLSSQGIVELKLRTNARPGYSDSYTWQPFAEELDEDVTYYYVAMSGFKHITAEGSDPDYDIRHIKSMMDESGIAELKKLRILGVRKNRIAELKDLDNWVWFEDKIKEEIAKVTDKNIISLVATEMLDGYYNKVYTSKNVAKAVGAQSQYHIFMENFGGIPRATGNVSSLVSLCTKYGKSMQVDKVKASIEDAKKTLSKKYPLLKYLNNADESEVVEYIKLVDRQEKV